MNYSLVIKGIGGVLDGTIDDGDVGAMVDIISDIMCNDFHFGQYAKIDQDKLDGIIDPIIRSIFEILIYTAVELGKKNDNKAVRFVCENTTLSFKAIDNTVFAKIVKTDDSNK